MDLLVLAICKGVQSQNYAQQKIGDEYFTITVRIHIFFNHGNNNLPRVYPTARKLDIPVTCDSAEAETSQSPQGKPLSQGSPTLLALSQQANEQLYPLPVLNL